MKKLYIIGNGFDLYHRLDTWYSSFGLFAQKNHHNVYDALIKYLYFPGLDEYNKESLYDEIWGSFEENLANLDYKEVLDEFSDYAANPASEEFRDRDWHTYQYYASEVRHSLTSDLYGAFEEFMTNVQFPSKQEQHIINIELESFYFTFNYTDTLERYYSIPRDRIWYIHNRVGEDKPLILGHGFSPDDLKPENQTPPEGLSNEELQEWEDNMNDQHEFSYEAAKQEILQYYSDNHKFTSKIIESNYEVFNKIRLVDEIFVLGHSLSDVDLPYFIKIFKFLNQNVRWNISFHKPEEKKVKRRVIEKLGVKPDLIKMIKIEDLI